MRVFLPKNHNREITKSYMRLSQLIGLVFKILLIFIALSLPKKWQSILVLVLLAIALILNRLYLKWVEVKIFIYKNPKLQGMTILHITDIHNQPNTKKILAICEKYKPDLIFDTGDTVDELTSERDFMRVIDFYKKLKVPIYRIDGNHEISSGLEKIFRREAEKIGVKYVDGKMEILVGQKKLKISNSISDPVDIALIHNPKIIDMFPIRAKLTLAGHTHGGRIWLVNKIIAPLLKKGSLKYASGEFKFPNRKTLVVSNGIGFSSSKIRLRCRPDVGLIKYTD